ncbi:MAG: hypothetical protein E7E64_13010 [Clostridium celatum]|nr:hypothetical protein [Clostridium celatum]MDU4979833.1 hypothetical protein [Clostridium celatum]
MGKVIEFPIISDKQIEEIERTYNISKEKFLIALGYEDNEEAEEKYKLYLKYNIAESNQFDRAIELLALNNSYKSAMGINLIDNYKNFI